ncbi:telomerase reverse transcriptase/regulator of sigma E protease [Trypanosoma cruzi]|nr:telomerase reverse transcriptase/regulator of sigma E protease [Trypanosoma cruzi]
MLSYGLHRLHGVFSVGGRRRSSGAKRGCGLRHQWGTAEFAYTCLGEKGPQQTTIAEMDAERRWEPHNALQGTRCRAFTTNTASGTGGSIARPRTCAGKRRLTTQLFQRLPARVIHKST